MQWIALPAFDQPRPVVWEYLLKSQIIKGKRSDTQRSKSLLHELSTLINKMNVSTDWDNNVPYIFSNVYSAMKSFTLQFSLEKDNII